VRVRVRGGPAVVRSEPGVVRRPRDAAFRERPQYAGPLVEFGENGRDRFGAVVRLPSMW
jgi:hypothetical protein